MIYLLAILAGGMVVLSMTMNSRLSRSIGVFQGVFVNYSVGLVTSLAMLALYSGGGAASASVTAPPWYAYCGALLGVAIVASCNVVIPRIPVVYSAVLIFLGQIITGLLLDALLSGYFDVYKALGAGLISGGLFLNAKIDAGPQRAD